MYSVLYGVVSGVVVCVWWCDACVTGLGDVYGVDGCVWFSEKRKAEKVWRGR